MPLSELQTAVLRCLAAHRDPESYVAGATPLNRSAGRYSEDIDIFNDRADRVAATALGDAQILTEAGYRVTWLRQLPLLYTAEIARDAAATRLEWVVDSDFRFFPTVPDPLFGYVLHPIDLAMNKAQAAAGRHELRDIVDLVTIHHRILPLGAVVWAAVEKSPGFTPEGLIAEIRRNSMYPAAEWRSLRSDAPVDQAAVMADLRAALDAAEAFVTAMPTDRLGLLFLELGKVVQPDPQHLERYETHAGQRRGHWPSSQDITAAMLEREGEG